MPPPRADLPPLVLVGLDSLQGLQLARLFASRGIVVHAVAKDRSYYSCRSRAVTSLTICNTAKTSLIEHLRALGPTFGRKAVLIVCQDKSVTIVADHQAELEPWYHMTLPGPEITHTLIDKTTFADYATSVGLPIPLTCAVSDIAGARSAAEQLSYPAVIKPGFRSSEWMKHTKKKAIKVSSPADMLATCERLVGRVPELVVQEWIPGTDADHVTCNVYLDRTSRVLGGFVSRKIRQWPTGLGQACLAEFVDDPEVYELTSEFFEQAGHIGFGYLEFKRHAGSGRLLAIEPNIGRPTGRSPMAERSGIDFHYLAYADAAGLPLPTRRGPSGEPAKWVHPFRDLQAAAHLLRRRQLGPGEWWRSLRGPKSYAVLSWRDPMPFLAMLGGAISELLSPRGLSDP